MFIRKASLALAAIALASSMPAAQNGTPAQSVQIIQLQHGHPFEGDVRDLPNGLSKQREKAPKGEEPPLGPDHGNGDSATQNAPGNAPAPPPGSGGGAGNFAGLNFQNWGAGWPPDTNGDVGPQYFIQTVNTSVGIFRKSDGTRVTAFSFDTLMSQGNFGNACDSENGGDVTVVYDTGADRWIISDFAFATNSSGNPVAPYFQCFAVSKSGDPVGGGWYFYSLQTNDLFPDYPKVGVWPDGLYLTANMFSSTFQNVRIWALNKTQMYAGIAPTALMYNLPAKIGSAAVFTGLPSTYHTVTGAPPAGRPNFIASIYSAKVARVWQFHVDWNNTANSTVTGPSNVTLASWTVAPTSEPAKNGNGLDTLYERLMVQNQYTNLGGTESLWLTHTVANPGNTTLAAPRWYQLKVTGGTVVTSGPLQQSTWAPDTTVGRWLPSLAVDMNGDMAIGYSASSSTLFPAIRYAGRLVTDPVSTLGQSETSLVEGSASQCCTFSDGTTNNRWGDYSGMTIDPDGCTFWYTNEYYVSPQPTTLLADNWQTQIGSFKFASCTPNGATLQGTVTDSVTNAPISGATVTVGTSSTTTGANGQYTLGSLTAGTFSATASAQGYSSSTLSVTVFAGVTTTQNFSLVSNGGGTATSLAVAAASGTYGGTTTLSATLTAGGNGVNGKSLAFTLNGSLIGNASTNASGIATLSSVSLGGIGAGSYPSGVGASFAGDSSFAASSGANSLTIAQASQTIAFSALPSHTYGDPPFVVSATASSGLAVSFGATGNCTISGSTVTITSAGSCTVTASQSGNANYLAATSVPQTFSIAQATQTITFNALPSKTYGNPPFTVSASASSNLAVSFAASGNCTVSGTTVTIAAAGSCTITASQSGNANYLAATSVPQTFSIAQASQTITFNALPSHTYGDAPFTVSATASSGLAVSFGAGGNCTVSGSTVTLTGAGSCTVTASQTGNANYLAATSVPQTFSIAQAGQTITFNALASATYGNPPFTVSATASSGLAVSFAAGGNCTVAGTTVTITGAGSCTITASQAGNANYSAAASVPQTFSIAQASQTITFNALPSMTYGASPFAVSATASSGLTVTFGASGNCTVSGATVTITGAGSCTVTASQAGNANYLAATSVPQTFSIAPANQLITFNPLPNHTASDPPFAVNASASSGLAVAFAASGNCTVSGNTVTLTGVGSCTITASQPGNSNFNAAPSVPQTFAITSNSTSETVLTTQVPASTYGGGAYELGMQVVSDVAGQITAVRFWKSAGETGLHTGRIWSATGQQLASVDFVNETASGWQVQSLGMSLAINANTTYVVSVNTNALWSGTANVFATPLTNGDLTAPGGTNGVYANAGAFPTAVSGYYNYFRDVVFVPGTGGGDTTPPTVAITAPAANSTVSGTVTLGATATDNVGVVGVQFQIDQVNLGAEQTGAGPNYSVSWDTTTASNSTHMVTAIARDAAGNRSSASLSVTVNNGGGGGGGTPETVFTTQVPASTYGGGAYELGMQVVSDVAGQITAVRFWKSAGETGNHTGRIWSATGQQLASVDFVNETASGWQVQNLLTPLAINANTTYVVSVNTNALWSGTANFFATPLTNGDLTAPAGTNGVYANAGAFPTAVSGYYNYFRDVVFTH